MAPQFLMTHDTLGFRVCNVLYGYRLLLRWLFGGVACRL